MNQKVEFGDFQTPKILADKMVTILLDKGIQSDIIVEPTCGEGEILLSAYNVMTVKKAIGIEINRDYIDNLKSKIQMDSKIKVIQKDIFLSFETIVKEVGNNSSILFIGNPPWVTNSGLAVINGKNLPEKENLKQFSGIEAITGKSNFDISEYILMKLIDNFYEKKSVFAFLCKTIVARNLLKYCWDKSIGYKEAYLYPIDSKKYFNASVDACYFIMDFTSKIQKQDCLVYDSIETQRQIKRYGYCNKKLIVDIDNFTSHNYFGRSDFAWRNGIKHDCSKVMELNITDKGLINGYKKKVDIEDGLIYPLMKSSDVSKDKGVFRKMVLVTQTSVGSNTSYIENDYPKTWDYLLKHSKKFAKRKSSIYKNKPQFSIFSIGEYSFRPFKIVISALYKKLNFRLLYPENEKSVMVDDTCNFISFRTETEAVFILSLLKNKEVNIFFDSLIFWDSKRPITTEILNSLDLRKVAGKLNRLEVYERLFNSGVITKSA